MINIIVHAKSRFRSLFYKKRFERLEVPTTLDVKIAALWDMMSCSLVSETWKEPAASFSMGDEPDGSSETLVNFHQVRGVTFQKIVIFDKSCLHVLFYPSQDEIPLS